MDTFTGDSSTLHDGVRQVAAAATPATPGVEKAITDAAADEVVVLGRKALTVFRRRQQWKGLVLFSLYFVLYICYVNTIIDWSHGGRTIQLYRTARSLAPGIHSALDPWCNKATGVSSHTGRTCWWLYKDMQTVEELESYMRFRIDKFPTTLREICPSCLVGITGEEGTLQGKSMREFTCADFAPTNAEDEHYPARDCAAADEEWAKNPTVMGAPCCSENSTLVTASLTLLAWHHKSGVTNSTLHVLLAEEHQETAQRFTKEYISDNIEEDGQFLQVMIIRGHARVAGIDYRARWTHAGHAGDWDDLEEMWSHRILTTSKTYWSRRWDLTISEVLLSIFCWVSSILSFAHSMTEAWAICSTRAEWLSWLARPRTWLIFITVLFPLAASSNEGVVKPGTWVTIVVVTELIMLLRFILEGEVIPACRILLRTIIAAAEQLATLSFVLLGVIMVIAMLYGQLFGVFMFPTWEGAFFAVLDQFGNGAQLLEPAELYNRLGSKLMYFLTMFILFLTLSQVFITVLMDGFESAREQAQETRLSDEPPEGYKDLPQELHSRRLLLDISVAGLTYWLPSHATTQPQVIRALKTAIQQVEEAYPELAAHPVGLSERHLGKVLEEVGAGEKALRMLVAQFGAAPYTAPVTEVRSNLKSTSRERMTPRGDAEAAIQRKLHAMRDEIFEALREAGHDPIQHEHRAVTR